MTSHFHERAMTPNTRALDHWIRNDFVALNTQLEELYFARDDRADVDGVGDDLKRRLQDEGREFIAALLAEGNTDTGFDSNFDLLGNVGLYMAACERHGITRADQENRSPLYEASALAMQLGASLGVTPRFATSHLSTYNRAIDGRYKSFTSLEDEYIFLDYKTLAVDVAIRNSERLLKVMGAYGTSDEYPAGRHLNDAWVGDACDGTRDMLRLGMVQFLRMQAGTLPPPGAMGPPPEGKGPTSAGMGPPPN